MNFFLIYTIFIEYCLLFAAESNHKGYSHIWFSFLPLNSNAIGLSPPLQDSFFYLCSRLAIPPTLSYSLRDLTWSVIIYISLSSSPFSNLYPPVCRGLYHLIKQQHPHQLQSPFVTLFFRSLLNSFVITTHIFYILIPLLWLTLWLYPTELFSQRDRRHGHHEV